MDTSKLTFNIDITYDCDEGEGCDAVLEDGTYEQAKHLLEKLGQKTWITGYYHRMSINLFDVYDENGEQLDLGTILGGEYVWVGNGYETSDKGEASETPESLLKFLEDLKSGDEGKKAREANELKARIKKLREELKEAEEELAELESRGEDYGRTGSAELQW